MSKMKTNRDRYRAIQRLWLSLRNFRFLLALVIAVAISVFGSLQKTGSQTPAPCQVSYRVVDQWTNTPPGATPANGGFKAEITITNTSTTAMNGWNVSWSFANGQNIYQLWDGSLMQSGANESVTNLSYNASIAPSTSRIFGFLATWSGTNSIPATFGGTCSGGANNV